MKSVFEETRKYLEKFHLISSSESKSNNASNTNYLSGGEQNQNYEEEINGFLSNIKKYEIELLRRMKPESLMEVEVFGLKAKPELNGQKGTVISGTPQKTGRYGILVDGNEYALKYENFQIL